MQPLTGKVILVTGGASGIGFETCKRLLADGAKVVLWDLEAETVDRAVQTLDPTGDRCCGFQVDVTLNGQVEDAMAHTIEAFGRLDGAFNNAGVGGPTKPMTKVSEEEFDQVVSVNLKGVWLCLKYELLHFEKNGGAIVNSASVAGLVALSGSSAYTAAKHGVVGLTKSAAIEYASAKVRVNAICPGAVKTGMIAGLDEDVLVSMTPRGHIGVPSEIASTAAWLLSDEASYINGAALTVDGGWSAQ